MIIIIIKKNQPEVRSVGKDVGKERILVHCWQVCKLVQPSWKIEWRVFKKVKIKLPYDPVILLLGIYLFIN